MAVKGIELKVEVAKRAGECQEQKKNKCQNVNVNKKEWREDDTSLRGYSADDGNAANKNHQHQHQHQSGNKHPVHQHKDEDACAYKMVPPDGGWGWMVALGTFLIAIMLPTLGPCFGVLFSGYLLEAKSSSTTTAWIFNLQCFLWFIIGIFTRPLTQEFGWRRVGLCGSALACVGMMISAFAPTPSFLFFSFSIMTGIGGGVVTCQCFTILPHYFQRRRGLTNAIMMSGVCSGQFVGPPVARYLQDNYGFRGATLILGAILLNSCIGASFFHPYEWHQKKVPVEEPKKQLPTFLAKHKARGSPYLTRELVQSPSASSFVGSTGEAECDGSLAARARLLGRLEGWKTSASSSRQSSRYNSTLSLSSMDAGSLAAIPLDDEQEKAKMETREGNLPLRVIKSILKDLGALRSLRACIICFGAAMCINGILNFIMMVPFAMLEAGFSRDTAAWCVSSYAGCNLVARILVSVLSDFPRFNKRLVYMSGFVIVASCIIAFTFLSSAETLLVVMALHGTGVGACMGIYNIVIIDVMGVERLASVFGASSSCVAIGFICIGPLIGFIRDATQSYAVSMRMTAGLYVLGLVAWAFMGVAERYDLSKESTKKTENDALEA